MTKDEVIKQFKIPIEVLKEYEDWGLCNAVRDVMGAWQYNEQDLERLSVIMSLHDIGFSNAEVELYIKLLLEGEITEQERLQMLNKRRKSALEEIHFKEQQLNRLDYLRHKMKNDA